MQAEFSEIMNHLSENAKFALQKSDFYSKRYNNGYMGTEHLLMGILAQDTSTGAEIIRHEGITLDDVEKLLNKVAVEVPGSDMAMMSLSEAVVLTLRMAQNFVNEEGLSVIGTEHILYAILTQPNSRAALILIELKADIEKMLAEIEDLVEKQTEDEKTKAKKAEFTKTSNLKFLKKYGKDLTEEARNGHLDTVIGREKEIERVVTVLSRRTKSNPVLIGEAGVGKTAIVEGLASRIAEQNVPGNLIGKHIYQVDLSSVVAGTKFRGEFEERIKGIIDEAVADESVLLFIDEIHLLCGAGNSEGSMDAANILKPELARNSLHLIGATTLDEYRKTVEKDKALSRRFQTVIVEEPSATVTFRILKGIKKHYEDHHGVVIPDEIIETAIVMSRRYINDRFMPDKVIDVIDEASAICKVSADKKDGGKYKKMKIQKATLEDKISEAAEVEDYEKAATLKTELLRLEKEIKKLEKAGVKKLEKAPVLTEENLATAISLKTGIPVSKVHGSEMKMLLDLESHIKESIVGQDEAVSAVAKAIRRGRSGIADSRRPIGSFIFMGTTGVGKTELAKALADYLFNDEKLMTRIDMSEYQEKFSVTRLIGAPPGYIGYDEGGQLTEAVRRKPYSVVLFDEIEKAHPDVFNVLLQVLDDGRLTDNKGRVVNFKNTIIIMTSNLGSDYIQEKSKELTSDNSNEWTKTVRTELTRMLKQVIRPEFINRIDETVVFLPLRENEIEQIVRLQINSVVSMLANNGIVLQVDDSAVKYITGVGYDPEFGARPVKRAIQSLLLNELSTKLLSDGIDRDKPIVISAKDDSIHFSN